MKKIFLIIVVALGYSPCSFSADVTPDLLQPEDLKYLGAFRLPGNGERPQSFSYGGSAMTWYPEGNPSGGRDHLQGSLFIMGHARMPYGELPDGNQIAEVTIPIPKISKSVSQLPEAKFLQPFTDAAEGWFTGFDEIPRCSMEYLYTDLTGGVIHLAWGQHYHHEDEPTHAWFSPQLSEPDMKGPWYIGSHSPYRVSGYLFSIPECWAQMHAEGMMLASGRFRDGGWSGMGPSLYAYAPWNEDGTPATPGTRTDSLVLLQYASSLDTEGIGGALAGYQHGDEWEGGAWVTSPAGNHAVLFVGTKSEGERYWYGFVNPAGPEHPCLQEEFIGEFVLCRNSDGSPCGKESLMVCDEPASVRGWWSDRFSAQIIFYDPDDFVRTASGELEPWQPQPYASLGIDEHLFLNPAGIDEYELGFGVQRRYRIGDAAYDRDQGLLYVLELFADHAKPVVHVWSIK